MTAERSAFAEYDPSEIRQDYTGYQTDEESGLEFAQARYYKPVHGRFTSVDPMTASATIRNPQTFNRYSYVLNSPYKFVDPLGLISSSTGACGTRCRNNDERSDGIIPFDSLNGRGGERITKGVAPESEPGDAETTGPYAGGVQIAPGLTRDEVDALVDAYKDLFATETGNAFFSMFGMPEANRTLILTVGDLSDHDKDGKTTLGLTRAVQDSDSKQTDNHLTITITLDIKRIDKAVADKAAQDAKNRDLVFGGKTTTGVETRQSAAKHELSHGLHAANDPLDFQRQVDAKTDETERAIYQALPGWDRRSPDMKGKSAKDEFKKLIRYSEYTFKK